MKKIYLIYVGIFWLMLNVIFGVCDCLSSKKRKKYDFSSEAESRRTDVIEPQESMVSFVSKPVLRNHQHLCLLFGVLKDEADLLTHELVLIRGITMSLLRCNVCSRNFSFQDNIVIHRCSRGLSSIAFHDFLQHEWCFYQSETFPDNSCCGKLQRPPIFEEDVLLQLNNDSDQSFKNLEASLVHLKCTVETLILRGQSLESGSFFHRRLSRHIIQYEVSFRHPKECPCAICPRIKNLILTNPLVKNFDFIQHLATALVFFVEKVALEIFLKVFFPEPLAANTIPLDYFTDDACLEYILQNETLSAILFQPFPSSKAYLQSRFFALCNISSDSLSQESKEVYYYKAIECSKAHYDLYCNANNDDEESGFIRLLNLSIAVAFVFRENLDETSDFLIYILINADIESLTSIFLSFPWLVRISTMEFLQRISFNHPNLQTLLPKIALCSLNEQNYNCYMCFFYDQFMDAMKCPVVVQTIISICENFHNIFFVCKIIEICLDYQSSESIKIITSLANNFKTNSVEKTSILNGIRQKLGESYSSEFMKYVTHDNNDADHNK